MLVLAERSVNADHLATAAGKALYKMVKFCILTQEQPAR